MPTRRPDVDSFARRLLQWFDRHGRHDLPWQLAATPYAVWVSEIMLQQTQVATVIPYFERFMRRFPSVAALAAAELDEVLAQWAGLGYYARARNLHRAAKQMLAEHGGELPRTQALLEALPGVGRSTAAAILALAHDFPAPILDGNVKRVLARYHGIEGWPGQTAVLARLWKHAAEHTPCHRPAASTQAIMDLGATLCTRHAPGCASCPVRRGCAAARAGTQHRLPSPRPRRARPRRRVRVLLIEDDDRRILLERRPPAGIWGGLFSLPELAGEHDPKDWCREHLHAPVGEQRSLPSIAHAFTHFDLEIAPLWLKLLEAPGRVMDRPDWLWYKPAMTQEIGLAAPIAELLESRFESNEAGA
jgi:A/G-specific adenine glycosylase